MTWGWPNLPEESGYSLAAGAFATYQIIAKKPHRRRKAVSLKVQVSASCLPSLDLNEEYLPIQTLKCLISITPTAIILSSVKPGGVGSLDGCWPKHVAVQLLELVRVRGFASLPELAERIAGFGIDGPPRPGLPGRDRLGQANARRRVLHRPLAEAAAFRRAPAGPMGQEEEPSPSGRRN